MAKGRPRETIASVQSLQLVKGENQQIYTPVYSSDDLEIGVLAPGKEASNNSTTKSYVGDRGLKPNHNDMLPVITKGGKRIDDVDLTFGQMFDLLGSVQNLLRMDC